MIWFQYVVGYDKQEQRSLATSLHNHLFDYRRLLAQLVAAVRREFAANGQAIALTVFSVAVALCRSSGGAPDVALWLAQA